MSFFDVARRLEAVIAREEGTETNHPASGCQITNPINIEMNVRKERSELYCLLWRVKGAYVLEKRHFPNKHTRLLNKIKFVRRKINQGTLEEWKLKMFLDIEGMRDMDGHTGGRKK